MTYRGTKQCVRKTTGHTAQLSVPGRCPRGSFASLPLVLLAYPFVLLFYALLWSRKPLIVSLLRAGVTELSIILYLGRECTGRQPRVCAEIGLFSFIVSLSEPLLSFLLGFPTFSIVHVPPGSWFCFLFKPTIAASHDSKSQHLQGLQVLNYISSLTIKKNNNK